MNVQYIDVEGIMKIELTINKSKDLPRGAIPALEKELLKRLQNQYENCSLVIRRAGGDSLTVFGGDKGDKTKVEEILQKHGKAPTTGFSVDQSSQAALTAICYA